MASIIAATSTADRKGMKGTTIGAKMVKDTIEKVSKEAASHVDALPPVDKGKKEVEEVPKTRFRIPRTDGAGGSADVVPPRSEVPVMEKVLGASLAAALVGQKRTTDPSKAPPTKRPRTASASSGQRSSRTKLLPTQRDDELAPDSLSMLPADVQTAASMFYKYWTERWENFMEDATTEDLLTILLGQTARAFGAAIEVQASFRNLQGKNSVNAERVAKAEEEAAKAKAEVEGVKRLHAEESKKLASTLVEVENMKKEVQTCQGEVASMMRRVENSNNLQKIASEALEKANKENVALKADLEKVELQKKNLMGRVSSLTEEVEEARRKAEAARGEAEKWFVRDFHLTEMYENFATYWRGYAYRDMIEWMEGKLPAVDTSELRQVFLEEGEHQTPTGEEQPLDDQDDDVVEVHNVKPLNSIPSPSSK